MKRAWLPILLVGATIVVLLAGMWWYEQRFGIDGPFPNTHHHGPAGEPEHEH